MPASKLLEICRLRASLGGKSRHSGITIVFEIINDYRQILLIF